MIGCSTLARAPPRGVPTVRGTPTSFINGILHQGGYDATSLLEALER